VNLGDGGGGGGSSSNGGGRRRRFIGTSTADIICACLPLLSM